MRKRPSKHRDRLGKTCATDGPKCRRCGSLERLFSGLCQDCSELTLEEIARLVAHTYAKHGFAFRPVPHV